MKVIRGLLIFFLIIVIVTCESDRCFNNAGEQTSKIVQLDSFKVGEIYSLFDVELIQDTSYFLEIITGENLLGNVEIVEKNDTLSIYNNNSCAWFKGFERPKLKLHFSDIETVNILESSYVYSTKPITDEMRLVVKARLAEANIVLDSKYFFFLTYGSTGGRYTFRGNVERLHLSGYYNALFDASQLRAVRASVNNYSIVDFKVWVEDNLKVQIHNVGNILYKGNPEILIDSISSSGQLISID